MTDKTLAIDFDGVLHEYTAFAAPLGLPKEGAVTAWHALSKAGYTLVVYTCREDHGAIRQWMRAHFHVDAVVMSTKPIALAYIDDRAIRFTTWDDIRKYFC